MFAFLNWRADRLRRVTARVRGLSRDNRGSVVIMFGLTVFIVFSIVGSAVDYGRAMLARARLQAAVDSSVLAAARVWQLENDLQLAEQKALAHFDSNKPSDPSRVVEFTPDMVASTFTMVGETTVKTPFLSFVNHPYITVSTRGQALIAGGGNAGTNLEVSLMLDVTGSMAGQRIVDLKAAAKDLIDIVIWADQSEYTSRIALAPFSSAVNAGALGPQVAYNPASSLTFKQRNGSNSTRYRTDTYCVSERTGAAAFTDAAPTGNNRIPRAYLTKSNSACVPAAPIVPMTSNKDALKSVIDGFVASGNTAGHLGTAWAWYLLSPNWASVLPEGSKPQPYSMVAQVGEKGQPLLRKVAVLMTDGEYNYQYCNSSSPTTAGASIPDYDTGNRGANCKSPNGTSETQALQLCTAMKATGISVYTVGFGLGGVQSAINLLRQCASEPHMFYDTNTGEELRNAFRHIATSIAAPILSR
ncbi:MAG: pilus assembly protein TadG-related protein [Hyphomicrobiaceae bacterium]